MTGCALCGRSGGDFLCYALSDWICPTCCASCQRRVFPLQTITLGPEGPRFRREGSALGTEMGIATEVNPFRSRTCPHFCPHVAALEAGKGTG